jgi:DNA-binding GntR family transcriptional regulator
MGCSAMSLGEAHTLEPGPPATGGALTVPPGTPLATSVQMGVRNGLRHDILNGRLAGGTRLHQADLAKAYGVSISPVREALRDLAADGLVDINPFLGAVVHAPTLQELENIYQVRVELIPLAVQMAVQNITEDELHRAGQLIRRMDKDVEPDPWVSNNARLHHILEDACRNDQLAGIMHRLADLSQVYVAMCERATDSRSHANRVHRLILQAYRHRDVDAAITETLAHINDTQQMARAEFKKVREAVKRRAVRDDL